ncbi:MAG: four helix bundle protein [Cyclobacteriaceae bacterium]|nr:four helix bundle protein [Cyclobacteriaceae bacterium]
MAEALDLTEAVYKVTRENTFGRDFGLINQIQRASVSIASNISEGDERMTNKESIYFFNVAKGSAAEVITHLHIAYRIGYLNQDTFRELENKTDKIGATLNSLIRARQNHRNKN